MGTTTSPHHQHSHFTCTSGSKQNVTLYLTQILSIQPNVIQSRNPQKNKHSNRQAWRTSHTRPTAHRPSQTKATTNPSSQISTAISSLTSTRKPLPARSLHPTRVPPPTTYSLQFPPAASTKVASEMASQEREAPAWDAPAWTALAVRSTEHAVA